MGNLWNGLKNKVKREPISSTALAISLIMSGLSYYYKWTAEVKALAIVGNGTTMVINLSIMFLLIAVAIFVFIRYKNNSR